MDIQTNTQGGGITPIDPTPTHGTPQPADLNVLRGGGVAIGFQPKGRWPWITTESGTLVPLWAASPQQRQRAFAELQEVIKLAHQAQITRKQYDQPFDKADVQRLELCLNLQDAMLAIVSQEDFEPEPHSVRQLSTRAFWDDSFGGHGYIGRAEAWAHAAHPRMTSLEDPFEALDQRGKFSPERYLRAIRRKLTRNTWRLITPQIPQDLSELHGDKLSDIDSMSMSLQEAVRHLGAGLADALAQRHGIGVCGDMRARYVAGSAAIGVLYAEFHPVNQKSNMDGKTVEDPLKIDWLLLGDTLRMIDQVAQGIRQLGREGGEALEAALARATAQQRCTSANLDALHTRLMEGYETYQGPLFAPDAWPGLDTLVHAPGGDISFRLARSGFELTRISSSMRHCVGSYAPDCIDGKCLILHGQRGGEDLVTVEVNLETRQVVQAKLARNERPNREVADAVATLAVRLGFVLASSDLKDASGELYPSGALSHSSLNKEPWEHLARQIDPQDAAAARQLAERMVRRGERAEREMMQARYRHLHRSGELSSIHARQMGATGATFNWPGAFQRTLEVTLQFPQARPQA